MISISDPRSSENVGIVKPNDEDFHNNMQTKHKNWPP